MMSLYFCYDIQIAGSEFGVNNMKLETNVLTAYRKVSGECI